MEIFLEAMGHLSEVIAILAQIKAAEKSGAGQASLPPIFIHHHAATWRLDISATRTTEPGRPPKPPVPSP